MPLPCSTPPLTTWANTTCSRWVRRRPPGNGFEKYRSHHSTCQSRVSLQQAPAFQGTPIDRAVSRSRNCACEPHRVRRRRDSPQANTCKVGIILWPRSERSSWLVLAERFPEAGLEPEGIAADPHTFEASSQRFVKFGMPAAGDPLGVEFVAAEIPLVAWEEFYLTIPQIFLEIRNGFAQLFGGVLTFDGVG